MSIEQQLERIADATEAILAILKPVKVVETTSKAVEVPLKVEDLKPVKIEEKVVEPTEDEIRNVIREYMAKNSKEKAIKLLVKYGAKVEKPMIKDVTQKAALMQELKA